MLTSLYLFSQLFNSLSGTSTIFAYLGEFLDVRNRSRSTMFSSVIFGAFSLFLPIVAMLIINQQWSFFIPVLQVTYKPWRFFLLACGLPSLISGLSLIFFPESPKFTFSQVIFRGCTSMTSRFQKIKVASSMDHLLHFI